LGRLVEETQQLGSGPVATVSYGFAANDEGSLVYPNDRTLNLQIYFAKSNNTMWNPTSGALLDARAGEVNMVPAVPNNGLPARWPTDGRDGGVPDPLAVGPSIIQYASEGGFFHWLWLQGLRFTTRELYERLKARKVLTVPGEYFFCGLGNDWPHRHECLRLNFSQQIVITLDVSAAG